MAAKQKPVPAWLDVRGPFRREGRIEWAILAELDPATLTSAAFRIRHEHQARSMWDLDEPRSWDVVVGQAKHSALIETAPGSSSTEVGIAEALSKELPTPVYTVAFVGYDDPDHGLPAIERYLGGKRALIWMAEDDGSLPTVPGPPGVPRDDPFDFAEALGCALRPYYAR